MKSCLACGSQYGYVVVRGTTLCRDCEPIVLEAVKQKRAAGLPANAGHIAKKLFREKNPIRHYLLNDIPCELWEWGQHYGIDAKMSMRDIIIASLEMFRESKERVKP